MHGVLRVLPICNPLPFCLLPCNPLPCTPLPCSPLPVFLSIVCWRLKNPFLFSPLVRILLLIGLVVGGWEGGCSTTAAVPPAVVVVPSCPLLQFPLLVYFHFCWCKEHHFGFCRFWAGTASEILVGGRPDDPRPRPPPRPRLTHQLPRPAPAFGDFITSTTPSCFSSYGLTGASWSGSSS